MSFSDLPRRPSGPGQQQQSFGSAPRPSGGHSDFQQLGEGLVSFERLCLRAKERVMEMRRRKVSPAEKQDLDAQISELKAVEGRLKNQLDALARQAESLPKNEVPARRTAVGKLLKDFERVRVLVAQQLNEVGMIKVSADSSSSSSSSSGSSSSNSGGAGSVFRMASGRGPQDFNLAADSASPSPAMPKLVQTLQGQDVDDLILEERERDIKKMNQDLLLVHEMFQDMANIVDQQGEMIEEIADMTQKSHDRAQAGLEQVKQAAAHQSSCIVS